MYTMEQIARMKKGLAPQRFNEEAREWVSKELHRIPARKSIDPYDVMEVWTDEPSMTDPFKDFGEHNAKL